MMDKDPQSYTVLTYAWVILLAVWGGTTHTVRKIKSGELSRFSIAEWIGDIVIAGFIGLITFYLCEYANIDRMLSAVLIGISSHQGARGIMLIERLLTSRATVEIKIKDEVKDADR